MAVLRWMEAEGVRLDCAGSLAVRGGCLACCSCQQTAQHSKHLGCTSDSNEMGAAEILVTLWLVRRVWDTSVLGLLSAWHIPFSAQGCNVPHLGTGAPRPALPWSHQRMQGTRQCLQEGGEASLQGNLQMSPAYVFPCSKCRWRFCVNLFSLQGKGVKSFIFPSQFCFICMYLFYSVRELKAGETTDHFVLPMSQWLKCN